MKKHIPVQDEHWRHHQYYESQNLLQLIYLARLRSLEAKRKKGTS